MAPWEHWRVLDILFPVSQEQQSPLGHTFWDLGIFLSGPQFLYLGKGVMIVP
jgi:hypothetical protein